MPQCLGCKRSSDLGPFGTGSMTEKLQVHWNHLRRVTHAFEHSPTPSWRKKRAMKIPMSSWGSQLVLLKSITLIYYMNVPCMSSYFCHISQYINPPNVRFWPGLRSWWPRASVPKSRCRRWCPPFSSGGRRRHRRRGGF